MKALSSCVVTLPLLLCVSAAPAQERNENLTTLRVRITSLLGDVLPEGQLLVQAIDGRSVYKGTIQREAVLQVPPGNYKVSFETPFVKKITRDVRIDMRETLIILATEMEDTVLDVPSQPVSITAAVHPANVCTPGDYMWARLVSVFSGQSRERRVSSGGYVLFEPVEVGSYVLMVIDGKDVRAAHAFTTKGLLTSVTIALPECQKSQNRE